MGNNETEDVSSQLSILQENTDMFFILINGVIVSLMQAGFACLEAGAVHSKNTANIILKNFLDLFLCGIAWWLVGYPLAYSEGNAFAGANGWAAMGLPSSKVAHWFFQFVFAATAATVLAGAVAERCQFTAYLVYSPIVSGITYPIVAHWAWSDGGWLQTLGFEDFAGSGAVHSFAGTCSLVAASILGPRQGRFSADGKPQDLPGHSLPLVGLGALLLVSGFLSFNGGSVGMISQKNDSTTAAVAMVNTIMAGSGAAGITLILAACHAFSAAWPFSFIINATLSGMVAVCAGADVYPIWAAVVIGAIACPIYWAVHSLVLKLGVDDPLDTAGVHLGAGFWGVLARPIFSPDGILCTFSGESFSKLGKNAIGGMSVVSWAAGTSAILFGTLRVFNLLRVTSEEEAIGLDKSKHGEISYPAEAWDLKRTPSMDKANLNSIYELQKPGKFARQDFENQGFEMEKSQ